MTVETDPQYPDDLIVTSPEEDNTRKEGAQHIRNIKNVLNNALMKNDGTALDKALLATLFPLGGMSIGVPQESSRPNDDFGGTWYKAGVIAVDNTTAEDEALDITEAWVWIRAA